MATKSKKSTAKAKKTTNGKSGKSATSRAESKTSKVIALMQRASGVTREEVLKVTGWKAVSMQQVATNAGVKLKIDDSERPYRYRAA